MQLEAITDKHVVQKRTMVVPMWTGDFAQSRFVSVNLFPDDLACGTLF